MRTMRPILIASAMLVTAVLAGCASGGPADPGSPSASSSLSPEAAAAEQLAAAMTEEVQYSEPLGTPLPEPIDLTGKTVYYIPLSLKVPYFTQELNAATEGLEAAGAAVRGCDGAFTPDAIVGCMDQAIGAGAAAVITSGFPYEMTTSGYDRLTSAGIPVLLAVAAPPADGNARPGLHYLEGGYNTWPQGETVARAIVADSDATAHVLYVRLVDSDALKNTGQAALDTFEESCSGCVVTVKEIAGARTAEVTDIVSGALITDPTIDYVFPQNASMLSYAITGVQNANATGRVKFGTTTGTLAALQVQKSNPAIIANAGGNTNYFGWTVADAAVRMLAGVEVPTTYPSAVRLFTESNIDSLDLSPEAEADGSWFGSTVYKDEFLTLWGRG